MSLNFLNHILCKDKLVVLASKFCIGLKIRFLNCTKSIEAISYICRSLFLTISILIAGTIHIRLWIIILFRSLCLFLWPLKLTPLSTRKLLLWIKKTSISVHNQTLNNWWMASYVWLLIAWRPWPSKLHQLRKKSVAILGTYFWFLPESKK